MVQGRVARGTLNHAGDGRSFGQGKVFQLSPEIDARGLVHPAHSDGGTLSEKDFVAVEGENVLL